MQRIETVLERARASSPPQPPQKPAPRFESSPRGECDRCKGAGFVYVDVPLGHPDFGKAVPCGCRKRNPASALPGRFQDTTFGSFDLSRNPNMREAFEKCEALVRGDIESVFLYGPPGLGKTHLLAATVRWRLEHDQAAAFHECTEMLATVQSAQFDAERDIDTEIKALASPDYLMALDDLGTHNRTAWREEQLYRVLNRRYGQRAPTIISSNTPLEEIDGRIRSRFREGLVLCEGDDLRGRL